MRKLLILAVLAFSLAVGGCATLDRVPESTVAKLTVQQAALRVIDEDVERALRVLELTETMAVYVQQEFVTVELIDGYLRSQINWQKLSLADAQLLILLLDQLRYELDLRIELEMLGAEDKVVVQTVIRWIADAAALTIRMRG